MIPGDAWVPRTAAEEEALRSLISYTTAAREAGIPPERIAGFCALATLSALAQDPVSADVATPDEEETEEAVSACPECGEAIHRVHRGLGGQAQIEHAETSEPCWADTDEHPWLIDQWDQQQGDAL